MFVVSAPLPLALGIAIDIYVATASALESTILAEVIAGATVISIDALVPIQYGDASIRP